MNKFRQKDFALPQELGTNFVKNLRSDPTKVAALGLSGTALAVSMHRNKQLEKQGKQQQKMGQKQLEAMQKLTDTLGTVNTSMQHFDGQLNQQQQTQPTKKKRGFFGKFFSVESGSYEGKKRPLDKMSIAKGAIVGSAVGAVGGAILGGGPGAAVGGIAGTGFGAFCAWMHNIADESAFNSGVSRNTNSYNLIQAIENEYASELVGETVSETDEYGDTTVTTTKNYKPKPAVNPKGIVYDIDGDPKKFALSVLYSGNVLVMYINNPTRQELGILNRCLDKYCYTYKNADYSSEQVRSNVYIVELYVVENTEEELAMSLINSGFKLNVITGRKFGVGKL